MAHKHWIVPALYAALIIIFLAAVGIIARQRVDASKPHPALSTAPTQSPSNLTTTSKQADHPCGSTIQPGEECYISVILTTAPPTP